MLQPTSVPIPLTNKKSKTRNKKKSMRKVCGRVRGGREEAEVEGPCKKAAYQLRMYSYL